jgi:hypothetical protein
MSLSNYSRSNMNLVVSDCESRAIKCADLGLDDRGLIPGRIRDIPLLCYVQTGSEAGT